MRKYLSTVLLLAAIVGIFVVCLVVGGRHSSEDSAFEGSDAKVTTQIEESNPDYQPWMNAVFSPGSAEIESGLFATQAAIGGIILGFCGGALWARRRPQQQAQHD